MKIISFLGLNSYQETNYQSLDKSRIYETKYYQEALAEFYQPNEMYIFLTKTVETKPPKGEERSNWCQLKERFDHRFPHIRLTPITEIPEQNSPEDVWEIFRRVNDCLQENDSVIFDITHSFRSIPVVALLAASYFRVVRNIQIDALIYGAFEASFKSEGQKITPTFDLLPVVRLFDWLTATDQFLKTGNGQDLATLLQQAGEHTELLGNRILEISEGLQLLRPMNVMKAAHALPEDVRLASPDLSTIVPPFKMLLGRVVNEYGQFAVEAPENHEANGKQALRKQLLAIEWYTKKGLYVQALSLAREWLPSLLCNYFKLDPLVEQPNRAEMEFLLSGGVQKDKETNKVIRQSTYLEQWNKLDKQKRKLLLSLWGGDLGLAKLRNDVLHSGFRKNPKDTEEIKQKLLEITEALKRIAQAWEIC